MEAEVGLLKHLHTYKQKTSRNTKESRVKRNGETAEGVQMLQKGGKVNYVRVLDKRLYTRTRTRTRTRTHAGTRAHNARMHGRQHARTSASRSVQHARTH